MSFCTSSILLESKTFQRLVGATPISVPLGLHQGTLFHKTRSLLLHQLVYLHDLLPEHSLSMEQVGWGPAV